MPHQLPLATLIELAQHKTDEATRQLGALHSAHHSAAERLELLLQYRQDYRNQLAVQARAGLSCAQLRNFQQFISSLDAAIEQQRALTQHADTELGHGRSNWQRSKRRLTSFDTLADRARQQRQQAGNRIEQRDNDERSARQFQLRANPL